MPLVVFFLALTLALSAPISQASQNLSATTQSLDINAATAQQLAEALPGIGPAKAARIVQWRNDNGAFKSVDQLTDVKGIGPKTLEKLRQHIRVGSRDAAAASNAFADSRERIVRADIRRVVVNVRHAALPASIATIPKPAWYKRSALDILRTH